MNIVCAGHVFKLNEIDLQQTRVLLKHSQCERTLSNHANTMYNSLLKRVIESGSKQSKIF